MFLLSHVLVMFLLSHVLNDISFNIFHLRAGYPGGARSPSHSPRRDYLAAYGSSMPVDYLYGRRDKDRSPSPSARRPRSPPPGYNPY